MRPFQIFLAIALTASSAFAQNWRTELNMIDHDLRTQHYAHARKWSIKMINSMCDNLPTGQEAMYTLGLTVAYRAIAESGLGKQDDGDWYWNVALSLDPDLAKRDWSAYGEAASRIIQNHEIEAEASAAEPVPIHKVDPRCPLSAVEGGYYNSVTLAAVVDRNGIPRCPHLVEAKQTPTLIYAAFEALKDWQFMPPPAPANYQVTVNFDPPRS